MLNIRLQVLVLRSTLKYTKDKCVQNDAQINCTYFTILRFFRLKYGHTQTAGSILRRPVFESPRILLGPPGAEDMEWIVLEYG